MLTDCVIDELDGDWKDESIDWCGVRNGIYTEIKYYIIRKFKGGFVYNKELNKDLENWNQLETIHWDST